MTNIVIVTSPGSWYYPHAKELITRLESQECYAKLITDHKELPIGQDMVFFLSYFWLVSERILALNKHNIVIHESDLPRGRGWAPLFWQVIEGNNRIPVVAFGAVGEMDAGPIYAKAVIDLDGTELHEEIRRAQAQVTRKLVIECIEKYQQKRLVPVVQQGQPTYYPKRTAKDSELDPNRTIAEQFDLLRTVNNREFPAFFELRGKRYVLTIEKDTRENV